MTQQLRRSPASPDVSRRASVVTDANALYPPLHRESAFRLASQGLRRAEARVLRTHHEEGVVDSAIGAVEAAQGVLTQVVDRLLAERWLQWPERLAGFPAAWDVRGPAVNTRQSHGLCRIPVDTILASSPDYVQSLHTFWYARPHTPNYEAVMKEARRIAFAAEGDSEALSVPRLLVTAGANGEPVFWGDGGHTFAAAAITGQPHIVANVEIGLGADSPERVAQEARLMQWLSSASVLPTQVHDGPAQRLSVNALEH